MCVTVCTLQLTLLRSCTTTTATTTAAAAGAHYYQQAVGFTADGTLKLMDFGLVKRVQRTTLDPSTRCYYNMTGQVGPVSTLYIALTLSMLLHDTVTAPPTLHAYASTSRVCCQ
jgi:hypothetical protein